MGFCDARVRNGEKLLFLPRDVRSAKRIVTGPQHSLLCKPCISYDRDVCIGRGSGARGPGPSNTPMGAIRVSL